MTVLLLLFKRMLALGCCWPIGNRIEATSTIFQIMCVVATNRLIRLSCRVASWGFSKDDRKCIADLEGVWGLLTWLRALSIPLLSSGLGVGPDQYFASAPTTQPLLQEQQPRANGVSHPFIVQLIGYFTAASLVIGSCISFGNCTGGRGGICRVLCIFVANRKDTGLKVVT